MKQVDFTDVGHAVSGVKNRLNLAQKLGNSTDLITDKEMSSQWEVGDVLWVKLEDRHIRDSVVRGKYYGGRAAFGNAERRKSVSAQ